MGIKVLEGNLTICYSETPLTQTLHCMNVVLLVYVFIDGFICPVTPKPTLIDLRGSSCLPDHQTKMLFVFF